MQDMCDLYATYKDQFEIALQKEKATSRAWNRKQTVENETSKNNARSNLMQILKEYRAAQADILVAHNMKVPIDFFEFYAPGCIFSNRVIANEKRIDSNKVKVFTECQQAANVNQFYIVFTLEKKDDNDKWIITRIRNYEGKLKKETPLLW
jgi:hypothetical protein